MVCKVKKEYKKTRYGGTNFYSEERKIEKRFLHEKQKGDRKRVRDNLKVIVESGYGANEEEEIDEMMF
jgi:hypothetical protein